MSKDTRWERSIETFSDEQLLFELVRRNGFQRAAKKTEYCGEGWMTSTVGIGEDHSVSITMDADDFKELAALLVAAVIAVGVGWPAGRRADAAGYAHLALASLLAVRHQSYDGRRPAIVTAHT